MPVPDTIPYPWPYDDEAGLAPRRCALVLVGLQEQWRGLDADNVWNVDLFRRQRPRPACSRFSASPDIMTPSHVEFTA